MSEPMLIHHHLKDVHTETLKEPITGESIFRLQQNIAAVAQQKLDETLTKACLEYLRDTGCTDLYMIDGEELVRRLRLAAMWDKLKGEMTEALVESCKQGLAGIADGAYLYVLRRMKELEKVDEEDEE